MTMHPCISDAAVVCMRHACTKIGCCLPAVLQQLQLQSVSAFGTTIACTAVEPQLQLFYSSRIFAAICGLSPQSGPHSCSFQAHKALTLQMASVGSLELEGCLLHQLEALAGLVS